MTLTTVPFPDGGVTDVLVDGRLLGWFDTAPEAGRHLVRDWDGEHVGEAPSPDAAVEMLTARDAA